MTSVLSNKFRYIRGSCACRLSHWRFASHPLRIVASRQPCAVSRRSRSCSTGPPDTEWEADRGRIDQVVRDAGRSVILAYPSLSRTNAASASRDGCPNRCRTGGLPGRHTPGAPRRLPSHRLGASGRPGSTPVRARASGPRRGNPGAPAEAHLADQSGGTWSGASCTPIRHSPTESMTL